MPTAMKYVQTDEEIRLERERCSAAFDEALALGGFEPGM